MACTRKSGLEPPPLMSVLSLYESGLDACRPRNPPLSRSNAESMGMSQCWPLEARIGWMHGVHHPSMQGSIPTYQLYGADPIARWSLMIARLAVSEDAVPRNRLWGFRSAQNRSRQYGAAFRAWEFLLRNRPRPSSFCLLSEHSSRSRSPLACRTGHL